MWIDTDEHASAVWTLLVGLPYDELWDKHLGVLFNTVAKSGRNIARIAKAQNRRGFMLKRSRNDRVNPRAMCRVRLRVLLPLGVASPDSAQSLGLHLVEPMRERPDQNRETEERPRNVDQPEPIRVL
jgi:hypothetical protein